MIYAKLQTQAMSIGGPIAYLEPEEGAQAPKTNERVVGRPRELWRRNALGK